VSCNRGRCSARALHRVFPRNAVVASRWCPVRLLSTSNHFQSRFRSRAAHAPFMFVGFPRVCRRQFAGADSHGIGGGVLMANGGWRRLFLSPPMTGRKGPLSPVVELVATRSLDLFLLQGLPLETRWLLGQRPVGRARPELVRYHLFFRPMGRASVVGARSWGTPVEAAAYLHIAN